MAAEDGAAALPPASEDAAGYDDDFDEEPPPHEVADADEPDAGAAAAAAAAAAPAVDVDVDDADDDRGGDALSPTELADAVREYLIYHNMRTTLEVFSQEAGRREFVPRPSAETALDEFLQAFDDGDRAMLFQLWADHIPPIVRQSDAFASRLEFYLHISLAVHPIRHSAAPSVVAREMAAFREYLETRGADLSRTPEFLPYYALPYVPDPAQHPSFRDLFTAEWEDDLRDRLAKFALTYLEPPAEPVLHRLCRTHPAGAQPQPQPQPQPQSANAGQTDPDPPISDGVSKDEFVAAVARAQRAEAREARAVRAFGLRVDQLHDECQVLFGIAANLLEVLAISRTGKVVNQGYIDHTRGKLVQHDPQLVRASTEQTLSLAGVPHSPSGAWPLGHSLEDGRLLAAEEGDAVRIDDKGWAEPSPSPQPGLGAGDLGEPELEPDRGHEHDDAPTEPDARYSLRHSQEGARAPWLHRPRAAILASLNYNKVKADLVRADPRKKARLLQALRWRLTKSPNRMSRRRMIRIYAGADLLLARAPPPPEENPDGTVVPVPDAENKAHPALRNCLESAEESVSINTAWLLNAIASSADGRGYLLEHRDVVEMLCDLLQSHDEDAPVRQHAIGALQKLSLRRAAQERMMERNVIKWLSKTLGDIDSLSDYTVEYASALLMNLSLRKAGKMACEAEDVDILNTLNDNLENDNMQVRAYINGTLYSVLERPALRERAKEMGMGEILVQLQKMCPPEQGRQIAYILRQLDAGEGEEDGDAAPANADDDDDEGEDDDMSDEEEDEMDEVDADEGEEVVSADDGGGPVGEEMLCTLYLAQTPAAVRESEQISEVTRRRRAQRAAQQSKAAAGSGGGGGGVGAAHRTNEAPLARPVTPADMGSTTTPRGERIVAQYSDSTDAFRPSRSLARSPPASRHADGPDAGKQGRGRPDPVHLPHGHDNERNAFVRSDRLARTPGPDADSSFTETLARERGYDERRSRGGVGRGARAARGRGDR